jgi:hypothetical protein
MILFSRYFLEQKLQYIVLVSLAAILIVFTILEYPSNIESFQLFLGNVNPLIVLSAVVVICVTCLSLLGMNGWFKIFSVKNAKGLLLSSGIAVFLGLIIVAVDLKVVFPKDMNIPFPGSLSFYPAIGFIVETLFHLLPLTLLIFLLTFLFRGTNYRTIIWICILAVSLLEPAYQVLDIASGGRYPFWVIFYVGLHLTVFNVLQLALFKRYDFVSMYAFRLVYYSIWHIGWGYLRLKLLF